MNMKQCLRQVNKLMRKAGYSKQLVCTEDNLSQILKEILEQYPNLFENEFPELYKRVYCIIDLDE